MTEEEIDLAEEIFKDPFDLGSFEYWRKTVNFRLDELIPIVNDVTMKGYCMKDICIDTCNEYNRLIFIRNKYLV